MKIVVEFNSLEEMDQFCNGVAIGPGILEKAKVVTSAAEKQETKKKGKAAKEEPAPAEPEAQEQEESVAQEPEQEYTLEDVRAKLGALQKAGRREEVKALLKSVGADKLPEVDPKDYPVLMQKAGELDA